MSLLGKRNLSELRDENAETGLTVEHQTSMVKKRKLNVNESSLLLIFKRMQLPYDVSKEIADFASGDWAVCSNKLCKQVICIINLKMKPETRDAKTQDAYFAQIGYKHCIRSNRFFCDDCMGDAVHLTYCSEQPDKGCCCHNLFHFKPNCEICECGNMMRDMEAVAAAECECHSLCCLFISCDNCDKKWCKECWENKRCYCQECHSNVCDECEYCEPTTSALQVNDRYYQNFGYFGLTEQCKRCYENRKQLRARCKTCQIECCLRHAMFPGQYYAETDRLPALVQCFADECTNLICFACGEGRAKEADKCGWCNKDMFPIALCEMHRNKLKLQCFYHRPVTAVHHHGNWNCDLAVCTPMP